MSSDSGTCIQVEVESRVDGLASVCVQQAGEKGRAREEGRKGGGRRLVGIQRGVAEGAEERGIEKSVQVHQS